jgi:hypothetical protein
MCGLHQAADDVPRAKPNPADQRIVPRKINMSRGLRPYIRVGGHEDCWPAVSPALIAARTTRA